MLRLTMATDGPDVVATLRPQMLGFSHQYCSRHPPRRQLRHRWKRWRVWYGIRVVGRMRVRPVVR